MAGHAHRVALEAFDDLGRRVWQHAQQQRPLHAVADAGLGHGQVLPLEGDRVQAQRALLHQGPHGRREMQRARVAAGTVEQHVPSVLTASDRPGVMPAKVAPEHAGDLPGRSRDRALDGGVPRAVERALDVQQGDDPHQPVIPPLPRAA